VERSDLRGTASLPGIDPEISIWDWAKTLPLVDGDL
jgi:hypothetical protein